MMAVVVPVMINPDRVRAAMNAEACSMGNVFLLDDGFQHWPLKRDLDIVAIDATNAFGNGHLLPRGVLNDYLTKTYKQKGKAQPLYRSLIESIERITRAVAEQLWTERGEPFPAQQTLWFEVWLRAGTSPGDRKEILAQFGRLGAQAGLQVGEGSIDLPEHTVVSARGKGSAFSTDLAVLNCIAEIR